MPVVHVDAPPDIRPEARKRMVERYTTSTAAVANLAVGAIVDETPAGRRG
jgi:hypothetical protein